MMILVTGANGFFGSEIVRQAMADSALQVRTTDRQAVSNRPDTEYRSADILDVSGLKPLLQGINCVVHVAGLAHVFDKKKAEKAPFKEINEIGTANVAQTAAEAGVKRFILISSVSVYGPFTRGVYDENAPCRPEGKYAESKYQAELRAIEIAKQSGMALTILRLATLYGAGDPGNVARLMKTIDHGKFIWIGKGTNRKSLFYKDDAARAVLAVLKGSFSGINIYNVSAPPCVMRDIVRELALALKRTIPEWHIPARLALGGAAVLSMATAGRLDLSPVLKKWLADDAYDAGKFARMYNFQTQVGLTEGLRREVEWYQGKVRGRKSSPFARAAGDREDRGQRTEDRGQRTEDRGQRTEDRGQRSGIRGQNLNYELSFRDNYWLGCGCNFLLQRGYFLPLG